MIRRLFRLVLIAGAAAATVAAVRALTRKDDPLPATSSPSGEPWPPLRGEGTVPPPPEPQPPAAVAPEPEGVPVSGRGAPWVEPSDDGECPDGYPIKAKMNSKIFHSPGQLNYDRTTPDRCYVDATAAESDGLRAAKR